MGFNWLRPAKHARVGPGYILFSSVLLGLPGIALGAGVIFAVFGRVPASIWVALLGGVLPVELALHLIFAHYWNRRADAVAADVSPR
jgi:hypothetical protein